MRWLVPVAVLACILIGTSMPHPPAMPGQSDKVVHFSGYASLGASLAWAARVSTLRRALKWAAVASMIGAVDELHQLFIPSRSCDVRDWMADTAGAVTGLSLVTALARRRESVA